MLKELVCRFKRGNFVGSAVENSSRTEAYIGKLHIDVHRWDLIDIQSEQSKFPQTLKNTLKDRQIFSTLF